MKTIKTLSIILIFTLIFTSVSITANANTFDKVIGTTPNGTEITFKEIISIDQKIKDATEQMYKEEETYTLKRNSIGEYVNEDFDITFSTKEKDEIFESLEKVTNENSSEITVISQSFYTIKDEYGIEIPSSSPPPYTFIFSDDPNMINYKMLLIIVPVEVHPTEGRSYTFVGKLLRDESNLPETSLKKSLAISWSGGESIDDFYSMAYYSAAHVPPLGPHMTAPIIIPNAGVAFKEYGTNGIQNSSLVELYSEVEVNQTGRTNLQNNVTLQYVSKWLVLAPSLSVDSAGASFSLSPGIGTSLYSIVGQYDS